MKKTHRTFRGRNLDMDYLREANDKTVAIGGGDSPRMNARGDYIGRNGEILQRREDIEHDYYQNNPNASRQVNIHDRLTNMGVPQKPKGSGGMQEHENVEFKTPQQIMEEAREAKEGTKDSTSKKPKEDRGATSARRTGNSGKAVTQGAKTSSKSEIDGETKTQSSRRKRLIDED